MEQLKNVKQEMESKKNKAVDGEVQQKYRGINSQQQQKQNKQTYNTSHGISTETRGQNFIENKIKDVNKDKEQKNTKEEDRCQNVYEKWKQKEKQKEQEKNISKKTGQNNKTVETTSTNKQVKHKSSQQDISMDKDRLNSKSNKKLQTHSPDYFYQKGQEFKQAKETEINQLFKERYPFQLKRDTSLTPTKKGQLHDRLFKEHKVKEQQDMQRALVEAKTRVETEKQPKVHDKYRQKVIERDRKIDQALGYLISHKMIENPNKIESISKSPFRRINLNNHFHK